MTVTDAPASLTTSGVGEAKEAPSSKDIKVTDFKSAAQFAGMKAAEHVGEFIEEGASGIASGLSKINKGAKMMGIVPTDTKELLSLIEENPGNTQLKGFVKTIAGTGEATFSALMHGTPAGAAITEGIKGIELIPGAEKVTHALFAPVTTIATKANGEELTGVAADLAQVGDFVLLLAGPKMAKETAKKFSAGEPLTAAEMNEAVSSALEGVKDPELVRQAAEKAGLKIKSDEAINQVIGEDVAKNEPVVTPSFEETQKPEVPSEVPLEKPAELKPEEPAALVDEIKQETPVAEEVKPEEVPVIEEPPVVNENVDRTNAVEEVKPETENTATTDIPSEHLLENERNYNMTDTKLDNAIGIVKSSDVLSFAADIPKKLKDAWQKYFTKEGELPKGVFEKQVEMKGEMASLANNMSYNIRGLKNSIKDIYKGKLSAKQVVELNDALAGRKPLNELPEKVAESINRMRSDIDRLSKKMIDDGLVEGKLMATIQGNLGTYMHRSYRIHDVPDWADKVPFEVVNRAKSFIRNAYEEKGSSISDADLNGIMQEVLHKYDDKTPLKILANGKLGSKDLSILKKRGDIAPEIRALWGEYNDPMVNYAKSVVRMSSMIAKSKFLNSVKEIGMGKFLFDYPSETHYKEIAAEGSKSMEPLNGLYTTPEIKAAFESFSAGEPLPDWLAWYMKINGFSKYAKTILSFPITHVRNFIANPLIMVRNGNVNLGKVPDAFKTIINELANGSNEKLRDKYKEYLKLGVAGEGVNVSELHNVIKDANKGTESFEAMTDNSIQRITRGGKQTLEKLYDFEDTIYKIFSFESEKAKYKEAYPDMPEAELNKKAADIVRATTPTYSEVPKSIQNLRRFPLTGTFVSFPYEIIRTTINAANLGRKELMDPATRAIGAKRVAGTLLAIGAPTAAAMWSRMVNNVSDEDDQNIRRFIAPWMKNSELMYIKNTGKGGYQILDEGNTDPHNYLKKPFIAALNGEDPKEATIDALKEAFSPFFSEEMLLSKILDVNRNKTSDGRQVYNEQDPLGTQVADMYNHFAKALEPGSIASIKKIAKGAAGVLDEKTGMPIDYKTEILNQTTGQRIYTVDIPQSLQLKWAKLDNQIGEAKRIYNTVYYTKGASEKQKEEAYHRSNDAIRKIIDEARKDFQAAIKLGVPVDQVEEILGRVRLNGEQKAAIADGIEYNLEPKE